MTTSKRKPATTRKAAATPTRKRALASPDFPREALGMAFVLVQHLDPDHKSLLLALVKKYTHIEIAWAEDGTEVRSGCAYIMPPKKGMALVGGRLRLVEPEAPRGQR